MSDPKMKEKHRWSLADTATAARIVLSVPLVLVPFGSLRFFLFYTVAGLTDGIDGYLARRSGTAGEFGARLDSIADLIFYSAMLHRAAPVLWQRLPGAIWFAVGAVVLVRVGAYAVAAVKYRRFAALHTYLNKLTGFMVFLLPYVLNFRAGVVYAWLVSGTAFLASAEELAIHILEKEYHPCRKRSDLWSNCRKKAS